MLCFMQNAKQANTWMSDFLSHLCFSDSDSFQSPVSTPLKSHTKIPAGFRWTWVLQQDYSFHLNLGPRKWNSQAWPWTHILYIMEKHLGSNQLGSRFGFSFLLITLYVFLKWSLTHPMKAKYNKSLINYLMLDIYIGSSYTEKKNPRTLPGCETRVLWHNMFLFISFQKLR